MPISPRIAVLSGKGGTGKTLVSVNLAAAAQKAAYVDCDVEEPDGHLFFRPRAVKEQTVTVKTPALDDDLCVGCRVCVDFCRFNALAFIKNRPFVFEDVCHGCGGCALLCPHGAIAERDREIGRVREGVSDGVAVLTGVLNIGQTSGIPIIKRLLADSAEQTDRPAFIDCPPGSACPVMESIRDADYCVLVAEPTVFSAHNLGMVYELATLFGKPCGAVLNKCAGGENPSEDFCREKGVPILFRIPFDSELGALTASGKIAARESERFQALFSRLLGIVMKEARHEEAAHS